MTESIMGKWRGQEKFDQSYVFDLISTILSSIYYVKETNFGRLLRGKVSLKSNIRNFRLRDGCL